MAIDTVSIDPVEAWMPVPVAFPAEPWEDAAEWADACTQKVPETDTRDALRLALLELQLTPLPLPGAIERFLWVHDFRHPLLAHVYVTDDAGDVEDLTELATAGIGGLVQSIRRGDVPGFDRSVMVVIVGAGGDADADGTDAAAVAARWIGQQGDGIVVVDLITTDALAFAAALHDLELLFAGVRLS